MRQLIAGQHSKAALELAKDLYKRSVSPDSEELLVEAYEARIDDLLKLRMTVEAKALLGIVRQRFPARAARLVEVEREINALEGRLEDILRPLGDPNLPAADRDRIEAFVQRRIHDLPALASVTSLSPEHPLRRAAGALAEAFRAVTEGPVEDAVLALPEVSRRSPLAPWKVLIRAIAAFHRGEDDACRRWLEMIDPESSAARLVQALRALLGAEVALSPPEHALIVAVGDRATALLPALAALEAAFDAGDQKPILDAARAMTAGLNRRGALDAELRERLRQHVFVRGLRMNVSPPSLAAAMGGTARQDAYFFRLLARTLEEDRDLLSESHAVRAWRNFRREAIREGRFAAGGVEDGVLALHMAQAVAGFPTGFTEEEQVERDGEFPSAGMLFERACAADPHAEAFKLWLAWAEKQDAPKVADEVAGRWREALPGSIRPLLYLMASAERRGAFKKSLKYLEEAEETDRLNPEVRRGKLRLLLAAAIRHLQKRKTHLMGAEIDRLAAVPEGRPGEVSAFAVALNWCRASIERDVDTMRERETELNELIGAVGGNLLLRAFAVAGDLDPKNLKAELPTLQPAKITGAELLAGATRACQLAHWAAVTMPLPGEWMDGLIEALGQPGCPLDNGQMLILAESALDHSTTAASGLRLAYAVSAAGLAGGGTDARFLFLRARSLPYGAKFRREACFAAALGLARRDRDAELAGRILDELNGRAQSAFGRGGKTRIASLELSPEALGEIVEEERQWKHRAGVPDNREPRYGSALEPPPCDCPACRAERGEILDEDEDDIGSISVEEMMATFEKIMNGPSRGGRKRAGPVPKSATKQKASPTRVTEQSDLF